MVKSYYGFLLEDGLFIPKEGSSAPPVNCEVTVIIDEKPLTDEELAYIEKARAQLKKEQLPQESTMITLDVDAEILKEAERILAKAGKDMAWFINTMLNAVIRIGVPDEFRVRKALLDEAYADYIFSELQKSKALLDDPNVELRDAEDVFAELDRRIKERGL
jgi:antitoxin component of RelBE/YafQ-DinJ toxin-antitoxin module